MKKTLTDDQRALVENNMALVGWYVDKKLLYCRREDRDDLIQTGMLALCRAALTFDPGRGARFTTYAMLYIAGDIRRWMRREYGERAAVGQIRLEADAKEAEENVTLGDTIAGREDGEAMARMLILREAIQKLERRTGRVILLHASGYNQKEIERRERTSQATVCRRLRAGREAIMRHIS